MAILTSALEPGSTQLLDLRSKPSFASLYTALKSLALQPDVWNGASKNEDVGHLEPKAVNRFLMSVVSSDLAWLQDGSDDAVVLERQDKVWELASRRMAERCGRTAMSEMTRTWLVNTSTSACPLAFSIREPPLTGDNLGFKTWGTAFTIAKQLENLRTRYFPNLLKEGCSSNRVLELGSGTGLVGIAAAAIWSVPVLLTDLPEIESNLSHNVLQNLEIVETQGGQIESRVLDWKDSTVLTGQEFEVVIAADPMYDDEHPRLVARMIQTFLKRDEGSRALVAVPLRDRKTADMAAEFKEAMIGKGFVLTGQGEEVCRDDWGDSGGDGVVCWWSIWAWKII